MQTDGSVTLGGSTDPFCNQVNSRPSCCRALVTYPPNDIDARATVREPLIETALSRAVSESDPPPHSTPAMPRLISRSESPSTTTASVVWSPSARLRVEDGRESNGERADAHVVGGALEPLVGRGGIDLPSQSISRSLTQPEALLSRFRGLELKVFGVWVGVFASPDLAAGFLSTATPAYEATR